jgi:hypothetical protein
MKFNFLDKYHQAVMDIKNTCHCIQFLNNCKYFICAKDYNQENDAKPGMTDAWVVQLVACGLYGGKKFVSVWPPRVYSLA